MRDLSKLLERFSRALGSDQGARESAAEVIKSLTNINIDPSDLTIRDNLLIIKSSPAKKNEIHLKEQEIISNIRARGGGNIVQILYR